ncbi:MAG TPA: ABC transporter substrate-binding protein [Symbiobacteriaceae bacterium]|jgi:putative ABC transport system substrate-binding protein|nr:ABC transporter substrate-binding protein [Symbiobacteriaceae bacterium]
MRWAAWLMLLLLVLLSGCGTPRPAAPVVAVLLSDDVRLPKVDGLRAGLAELGYGAVDVQVYSAKGDRLAVRTLAQQALAGRPAVAVAGGGIEALALKEAAASTIPVVMMGVASSVRSDLVQSFLRPGGNVTGLDNQHAELSAKRLELLTKLLPSARRVLLLYDPQVVPGGHALAVTEAAAQRLGVAVKPLVVESLEGTLAAIRNLQPGQYDAALLLPGYVLESGAGQVAAELERLGIPVMGPLDLEGDAGLLAAYGTSMRDQGIQSARFVVKVLRGQSPAAIPVETPDNPALVVDMRVARRLGIRLSPVGLAFARVIGQEAGGTP